MGRSSIVATATHAESSRVTHSGFPAKTKNDGGPFVPYAIWKDLFFAVFILLAVATCALSFGPSGPPDPTIIQTVPKPEYFFLLFALLSLLPSSLETLALLIWSHTGRILPG
jgi:quinol-cytochrome oxidoreductase complex cytochrome b subunit